MDAAFDGDTIKVATGIYTGVNTYGGLSQVVYLSKDIVIRGGYASDFATPSDPSSYPTIVDAEGQGRVFYITSPVSATVEGLHITRGDSRGLGGDHWGFDGGGGVYGVNAVFTIRDSFIYSNTSTTMEEGYMLKTAPSYC